MPDPDLKIRGREGGGGSGGGHPPIFFRPFGPQFGLKIRGLPAPPPFRSLPLDPPLLSKGYVTSIKKTENDYGNPTFLSIFGNKAE